MKYFQYIQIFINNLVLSTLSVIKIIILSKFHKQNKLVTENNAVVILGNGPSLINSYKENKGFINSMDKICVNHFAETNLYSILKPNIYILAAPEMWIDDVEEFYFKKGEKLFSTIANSTKWYLSLFIPANASKFQRWQKEIKQNKNITIHYFNTTPIEGFNWFENYCFSRNWGMPRPHNVLIPSLIIAINTAYKKIYLLGADHSWMKDIWVSDNNEVLLTQKHFYDIKTAIAKPMDNLGKGSRKMHEVLIKFVYAFKGYFRIKEYADYKGVEILNATPESYIDAFKRYRI